MFTSIFSSICEQFPFNDGLVKVYVKMRFAFLGFVLYLTNKSAK